MNGWYINCPGHANNDGKQKSKDVKMRDYVLYNTMSGIPNICPKLIFFVKYDSIITLINVIFDWNL